MKSQKDKKNKQVEMQVCHDPFLIRKCIFLLSFGAGLLAFYFLKNTAFAVVVYFVVTALLDVLAQHVLKLKASDFSDPKQLLKHERISPQNLDRYYASRSHIRVLSLAVAGLSQFLMFSPILFCSVYVGMTLIAAFYAWYKLDIQTPIMIYRDDSVLLNQWAKTDSIAERNFADIANGFLGVGIYGRWGRD